MTDLDLDTLATFRHRLDHLGVEGRQLRGSLADTPDAPARLAALGVWQRESAATISQLSGGRKTHWLARAFSDALLVPLAGVESASVITIIDRILDVLDRARLSLADATGPPAFTTTDDPPPRARFTFVANEALRSDLERAYRDGVAAYAREEFALALVTYCSILETVMTDALERRGLAQSAACESPAGPITGWPFETRIGVAERAGLISRGCGRLSDVARQYRSLLDANGELASDVSVSSNDAKRTRDVLHVILRDLAPGR